jgi:3D (Asp-Asp-Asp) domain-containing protein
MNKMARRWRKKIDIYMGDDVEAAHRWGVREVVIRWSVPPR